MAGKDDEMGSDDVRLSKAEQDALRRLEQMDTGEIDAFAEEFHGETDRAAVVLGAAKLDELLRKLVERCLLPATRREDELLGGEDGGDAPLASFSARINAAYRLGLISDEFRRSLDLVRRIRNAFAHRTRTPSLNASPFRDQIRELSRPIPSPTFWEALMRRHYGDEQAPRVEFRVAVAVYACLLESAVVLAKRLPEQRMLGTMMTSGRDRPDRTRASKVTPRRGR